MILKGFIKRVAELKKKTKEQLINYIIEKERRRNDSYSYCVSRVDSLSMLTDRLNKDKLELKKRISYLEGQLSEKEKINGQLEGLLRMNEDSLNKAYAKIHGFSQNIAESVLKKFKELKKKFIEDLVNNKVELEKERLKKEKDEEIFAIFEHLGINRESLMEILTRF